MKGGKRAGAGRPRRNADALDVKITVRLTANEAAALRAYAEWHKQSASEAARELLHEGALLLWEPGAGDPVARSS